MSHGLKVSRLFSEDEIAELQAFGDSRKNDGVTEWAGDSFRTTSVSHLIQRLFDALQSNFIEANGSRKLKLQQVWLQQTSSKTPQEFPSSSPFAPHIDNQRYYKAMLLLPDTSVSHGPFMTSGHNPNDYESLRADLIRHNRQFSRVRRCASLGKN